jgi:hypothetical protein
MDLSGVIKIDGQEKCQPIMCALQLNLAKRHLMRVGGISIDNQKHLLFPI